MRPLLFQINVQASSNDCGYSPSTAKTAYFDAGIVHGLKSGRRCIIYRLGEPIRLPDTGDILGWETDIIAEVEITYPRDNSSNFRVLKQSEEDSIVVGDKFVTK